MVLPSASLNHARPARPRAGAQARGFTMVELIVTLVLLGILAAVAVPRLSGALGLGDSAWRDQVLGALKSARSLSQGHRRLVCVTVSGSSVSLGIAAANPATSCGSTLAAPDGSANWAQDGGSRSATVTPAGTLYFQPGGRVTSDGAGNSTVNASIAVTGAAAITLNGTTGHVE